MKCAGLPREQSFFLDDWSVILEVRTDWALSSVEFLMLILSRRLLLHFIIRRLWLLEHNLTTHIILPIQKPLKVIRLLDLNYLMVINPLVLTLANASLILLLKEQGAGAAVSRRGRFIELFTLVSLLK